MFGDPKTTNMGNYSTYCGQISKHFGAPHQPIADSGATDTLYRRSDAQHLHDITPGGGIYVGLPNGDYITSVATGSLRAGPQNQLTIPVHVFRDHDLDRTLVSLADYCNRGCTVTLTNTDLTITHDATDSVLVHGSKLPTDKLWPYPTQYTDQASTPTHSAHAAMHHALNADFVAHHSAAHPFGHSSRHSAENTHTSTASHASQLRWYARTHPRH